MPPLRVWDHLPAKERYPVDQIVKNDKELDWKSQDMDVRREGRHIILPAQPAEMPIDAAIEALIRKKKDEEQEFNAYEIIDAHPLDAIVCVVKAMKELYGWASPVPTPGFFGDRPPKMLSVRTGPHRDDVIQVPWGAFKLPNVENLIQVTDSEHEGRPVLIIHGTVRKKEQATILELASLARKLLETDSIYKGKAFTIPVDSDGDLQVMEPPKFMDVADAKPEQLLLNSDVVDQVRTSLWGPIENTDACRQHRIPLKRGVLLEGPYGCGKSLTSRITAKIAQDNGWTFINLDRVQGLHAALEFAQRYQPAVVFAEDIDRITEERDEDANDLVNTIDGVLSKNAEVMVVLTTNHVERIQQVMLRPGRLDAVISIPAPDSDTVQSLVRLYGRGLIDEAADLSGIGEVLAGQIPATIREVVERSKLAMVVRGEKKVSAEALLVSANGMTTHLRLLNAPQEEQTDAEKFYEAFKNMVADADGGGTDFVNGVNAVTKQVGKAVEQKVERASRGVMEAAVGTTAMTAEIVGTAEKRIRADIVKLAKPQR